MKDFIISTLDGLLQVTVVVVTIAGFFIGGSLNLTGDFSLGLALIGGAIAFFSVAIGTGAIFTLIRIKELLEQQVRYSQSIAQLASAAGSVISKPAPAVAAPSINRPAPAHSTSQTAVLNPTQPAVPSPVSNHLTEETQKQFLELVAAEPSLTDAEIVDRLQLSRNDFMTLRARLRGKFNVYSHAELVQKARESGDLSFS